MRNFAYCIKQFTLNLVYLLWHLKRANKRRWKLKQIFDSIGIAQEIGIIYDMTFHYKKDRFFRDWRPWMINLAIKDFRDDCDGWAAFAKWVARKKGWRAEYWSLFGKGWGHAVCLIWQKNVCFIADTQGVRKFILWKVNFPKAKRRIKRWY